MSSSKKTIAIIQARMGSTRLPDKVLMDIEGKPMLWHIVNRLKHSELIDKIIIATSVNRKDDAIENFCKQYKIDCYRGSEDDVLGRYYQTAKVYKADPIVRITSDCPLIDPQIVDLVIERQINIGSDYTSNTLKRTFPRGLDTEVFTYVSLEKAYRNAKKSSEIEHVTVYFHEHPRLFKLCSVENNEDLSGLRWTVDEEPDLIFVREIYKRLFREDKLFLMQDILKLLEAKKYLLEINKRVKQKKY